MPDHHPEPTADDREAETGSSSVDVRIGTVIDKYRVVRFLGRGGMGSVYEAHHVSLQRRFAIKFMLPEYAANREILRRFEIEAKAAGQLEHANIAAVTDFGRAPDASPYLVMEYLAGQDCASLLASNGPLPAERAANLIYQACLGLAVAHKANIVHRDIKPENLFVTDAGDGSDLVKVLDFGIAKLRIPNASAMTGSGAAMGTFFYMAPEQMRDSGKVDERADVWALGVVLYELLTGKKPFDGADTTKIMYQVVFEEPQPLRELRPELSPNLVAAVQTAMSKAPDDRFASVMAMGDAIAPFTGRSSIRPSTAETDKFSAQAQKETTLERHATTSHASVATLSTIAAARPSPISSRKSRLVTGIVVVAVMLVAVAAGLSLRTITPEQRPHDVSASISEQSPPAATAVTVHSSQPSEPSKSAVVLVLPSASTSGNTSPKVRTTFEHARTTSNAAPGSSGNVVKSSTADVAVPDKALNANEPPARVPEKPAKSKLNPITIDTSSPF